MKASTKRSLMGIAVLAAGAVVYRFYSETAGPRYLEGLRRSEREMKQQLPQKVDEFTTLVDVKYDATKTTYWYVIDAKGGAIDTKKLEQGVRLTACSNAEVARTIKTKAFIYAYHYSDFAHRKLADFEIVSCG